MQPHVPMCQEKHRPTLFQDTACALKTGEDDMKNLRYPHAHVLVHTHVLLTSLRHSFSLATCPIVQTKGTPCILGQVLNEASL